ncbi:MAG: hypothetical protein HYZ94_03420 [Candidatus Omnitrophica bacterium]|nr:hypothetical protein [Candidatus Omnitrophota bacterium]
MTKRQRENVAKYFYDISKIIFATVVLGNLLATERFNVLSFLLGSVVAYFCLEWGYTLDGKEGNRDV